MGNVLKAVFFFSGSIIFLFDILVFLPSHYILNIFHLAITVIGFYGLSRTFSKQAYLKADVVIASPLLFMLSSLPQSVTVFDLLNGQTILTYSVLADSTFSFLTKTKKMDKNFFRVFRCFNIGVIDPTYIKTRKKGVILFRDFHAFRGYYIASISEME